MDEHGSYDLNLNHEIRYFTEQATPERVLRNIRRWIKENQPEVVSIEVNSRYDEFAQVMAWSATVVYLPEGLL